MALHSWQQVARESPIRSFHAPLPLLFQLLLKSSELSLPAPGSLQSHLSMGTFCFVRSREHPVGFSRPAVHCPHGPLPPLPSVPFLCRLVSGKNSPRGNFIFYCWVLPWLLCASSPCPSWHLFSFYGSPFAVGSTQTEGLPRCTHSPALPPQATESLAERHAGCEHPAKAQLGEGTDDRG